MASEPVGAAPVSQSATGSQNVAMAASGGTAIVNVYGAPPPIDDSRAARDDVAYALSQLERRNSLYASLDNELWRYVFDSLRGLREILADTGAKLRTHGPSSVTSAVRFMTKAIGTYLAQHEASYTKYMSDHGGWEPGWAHVEQDWLASADGAAADDLLQLRAVIDQTIQNLNAYADTGEAIEWREPSIARYWAEWAHRAAPPPRPADGPTAQSS